MAAHRRVGSKKFPFYATMLHVKFGLDPTTLSGPKIELNNKTRFYYKKLGTLFGIFGKNSILVTVLSIFCNFLIFMLFSTKLPFH